MWRLALVALISLSACSRYEVIPSSDSDSRQVWRIDRWTGKACRYVFPPGKAAEELGCLPEPRE